MDYRMEVQLPDGSWADVSTVFQSLTFTTGQAFENMVRSMWEVGAATEAMGKRAAEAFPVDLDKPATVQHGPYPGARSFAHRGRK